MSDSLFDSPVACSRDPSVTYLDIIVEDPFKIDRYSLLDSVYGPFVVCLDFTVGYLFGVCLCLG